MGKLNLLDTTAYYQALLREVPKAEKRIVIAAMIVVWGERTAPVFVMLRDALARGVQVTILLDNYTRLAFLYGLRPKSTRSHRIRQTFETLEELSGLGAKVYCFGKIGIPPYKGRCHVKATIVDDQTFSFGGMNFIDQMFDETDYMLAGNSRKLAGCLVQLVERIGTTRPPLPDGEVTIDKQHSVLFDGGRPNHSLIYERACELTTQAKRVVYVSQMAPSGELSQLLAETDARLYYNRPEQMNSPDAWAQAFDEQRYHSTNHYTGSQYIHAKFMLFELPGGRKAVLSGSHNFSHRGVSYGTQEIAMHSTDPALWQALHTFTEKNVAQEETKG
jgi:cardiolipin synthase A/B